MNCYRSWAEVSLDAIAANFRKLRDLAGPQVEMAAVVKSEAYGHGAIPAARTLVEQGARWLAVSTVEEGIALRNAGIAARILVMADNLPFTRPGCIQFNLTPVLHTLEDIVEVDRIAAQRGQLFPCHLKLDTGMGRLGIRDSVGQIAATVRNCPHIEIEGLMSHLASACDYAGTQTEEQIESFDALCTGLRERGIRPRYCHLASSGPIVYGRREAWFNMARPGLALYGYAPRATGPAPAKIVDLEPALSWKAAVLAVKDVPEGACIGYGALFRASKPMRIAVIGAGYADGVPHRLSNRGHVIAGGCKVPILGAVSMDLTTIDATPCPSLRAGDAVTILGVENGAAVTADDIAGVAGTISYDVLCGIRQRVPRVYV